MKRKQRARGGDGRKPDKIKPEVRDRQIARAIRRAIHDDNVPHDVVVARWRKERSETWIREVIAYRRLASEGV